MAGPTRPRPPRRSSRTGAWRAPWEPRATPTSRRRPTSPTRRRSSTRSRAISMASSPCSFATSMDCSRCGRRGTPPGTRCPCGRKATTRARGGSSGCLSAASRPTPLRGPPTPPHRAQAHQFETGGQLSLPISERALRWDQRHTLACQALLRYPGQWGMHAQWSYGSGLPFTPQFRNDRRRDPRLENSPRLPSASRLELAGDRYVHVWGQDLTLFMDARNVLDARNIAALSWGDGFNPNVNLSGGDDYAIYYTETGRAGGAYLQDTNGDQALHWVPVHHPRVYEEGRNVRLGLAMKF